jgi:hypothetical protein
MADIFISYANEDRERAAQLAAILESVGWSVWWDRRIPAGRTWRSRLEEALVEMRCMVVLWSKNSVKSPWVVEEAEEARRLGKTLVPVLIERVEPPMGFRAIQAADLVDWDASPEHPAARVFIADLKSLLGSRSKRPAMRIADLEPPETRMRVGISSWFSSHWPKAALGAFMIVVFVAAWQYGPSRKAKFAAPTTEIERLETAAAPRLTHVAVIAGRKKIKPSETLKLALKGKYSDGSESDLRNGIEWLSSDPRVATVDAQGEVTAWQAGTTNIIAKIGAVQSSEWTLGVESVSPAVTPARAAKLVALELSSSRHELVEKESVALRAKGRFSDNTEKYLSSGIEWQISDRTVASVNARGELVALRPGKIQIVARSDDLSSAPLTLLIKETRRNAEEAPPKPVKAAESPVKLPGLTNRAQARIVEHLGRAQTYREQGNYAAALAELERAKAIDASDEEIRKEIDQTRRACNAEKALGHRANC